MTKSWAVEHAGSVITCNDIQPGLIETPAMAPLMDNPEMLAAIVSTIPVGWHGVDNEIAAAAPYSHPMTPRVHPGYEIVIDGGLRPGWVDHSPVDRFRTLDAAASCS